MCLSSIGLSSQVSNLFIFNTTLPRNMLICATNPHLQTKPIICTLPQTWSSSIQISYLWLTRKLSFVQWLDFLESKGVLYIFLCLLWQGEIWPLWLSHLLVSNQWICYMEERDFVYVIKVTNQVWKEITLDYLCGSNIIMWLLKSREFSDCRQNWYRIKREVEDRKRFSVWLLAWRWMEPYVMEMRTSILQSQHVKQVYESKNCSRYPNKRAIPSRNGNED